jgi:chemotaxis protein MotA
MITLVIGFLGFVSSIIFSVGTESWKVYLQPHSMVMVFCGTLAVLIFSTPPSVLKSLSITLKKLFQKEEHIQNFEAELIQLSQNRSAGLNSSNELIRYASELWEKGIDRELFIVLLSQKKNETESRYSDAVQALKNLVKYPPALGMTGTVISMVALFTSLEQNRGNIGVHLSMAMTATFLGLIMANGLVSPLADRVQVKQVHEQRILDAIYEILLLVNRDEASHLIGDEVKTHAA